MEGLIFGIVYLTIVASIIGGGMIWTREKMKKALAALSLILENPQLTEGYQPALIGKYGKRSVRIEPAPGGKNSPESVTVMLFTTTHFTLNIRAQGVWSDISKKIGFLQELEIGIKDFDDRFIIQTSDEIGATNLLKREKVRDGIKSLFDEGFSSFEVFEGAIKIFRYADLSITLEPTTMQSVLKRLILIAEALK